MSDAVQIALIVGLPPTLAALGALWVSIRNSAKADVIVGHVNSAATKAAGEIAQLRKEVELLTKVAAENREIAALLAMRARASDGGATVAAAVATTETLKMIEVHTKAIDDNTKTAPVGAVGDVTETLQAIEINTEATADATAKTLKTLSKKV